MKRAIVKNPISASNMAVLSTRTCSRDGCSRELTKTQKKYCSGTCRNLVLSPGNNGGAPTKYRPEFAETLFEAYIDHCEKANEPALIPTQSSYIVQNKAELPSNRGFTIWLWKNRHTEKRLSTQTLDNWSTQNHEFALALDELKSIQREFLINNGLAGRYNPAIAKMILNVNHGMVERKEVDNRHQNIGILKHIYGRADEMMKEKLEERKLS